MLGIEPHSSSSQLTRAKQMLCKMMQQYWVLLLLLLLPAILLLIKKRDSRLGRSRIRIHGGTKPEHSTGCVLVSNPKDREKITEFINQNKARNKETVICISCRC